MTNPKNSVSLLFIVVLTASVFLLMGRHGNGVYSAKPQVAQHFTDKHHSILPSPQAEYLEEVCAIRLVSLPVFSTEQANGMLVQVLFGDFSTKLATKSYLGGSPLLCLSGRHRLSIHGP